MSNKEAERLALHLAVYDDNLELLQSYLLEGRSTEELDNKKNTPLLLAYRMGRTKAAEMLIAAGAYRKPRAPQGWEAVQVSSLTCNPDLIRTSVMAFLAETDAAFERRMPDLRAKLKSLPDFTMQMSWEFNSWIPLVSKLLPSDTYCISKRGNSLRIDTTLLGMSGVKWERGSISLLVMGDDTDSPGSVYVLDNEMKTAADARLAFTHPQDQHIQDWVRKLLTQKQKATDFWSRDVVMTPALKTGIMGGLMDSARSLVGAGESVPRGRVSEGSSASEEESSPVLVHVPNPKQVTQEVGGWGDCVCYEMKNLCVRDYVHAPLKSELKLSDWWKPEYSVQLSSEEAKEAVANLKSGEVATSEAPEKLLLPLHRTLRGLRLKKVNEDTAKSTTLDELIKAGMEDEKEIARVPSMQAVSFADYFGFERDEATEVEKEQYDRMVEMRSTGTFSNVSDIKEDGHTTEHATEGKVKAVDYIHSDGKKHKPIGLIGAFRPECTTMEDKSMDLKVYFCDKFPFTIEQFTPIAEVMARTSHHAGNVKRFFETKMPKGAGFPVRFTMPVFPSITATVTFEMCDTRRSPPATMFTVPEDYKMGAYVERGFIRQL